MVRYIETPSWLETIRRKRAVAAADNLTFPANRVNVDLSAAKE
jgi:hypothetical protein